MNPTRPLVSALALGLLVLAGCGDRSDAAPAAAVAEPAREPATVAPPAADPAPAPAAAEPVVVRNDPAVIHFRGLGQADFGSGEQALRDAWAQPLKADTPSDGSTCYFLRMDPGPGNGFGVAFMFEGGRFARYDVDSPAYAAPGDLAVGMRADQVLAAFPGRVQDQPDKYAEGGRNLVVSPEDGSGSRLVFDVDAAGTITGWRIGVPPQVHYVEGCS